MGTHRVRAYPLVARDLLRRKSTRHEPEDLDLAVGEAELDARAREEDAPGDDPAGDRAKSADEKVHAKQERPPLARGPPGPA